MQRRNGSDIFDSNTNNLNKNDFIDLESNSSKDKNQKFMPISRRACVTIVTGIFLLCLLYIFSNSSNDMYGKSFQQKQLSERISEKTVYRIGMVTDLDHDSKDTSESKTFWKSFFRQATLTRNAETNTYSVTLDSFKTESVLRTRLNLDGRGMELSWLQRFNGKLFTGDDRAGIVYEIENGAAAARLVLADGDGSAEKGFKSEWAAVKDGLMYIGSFGKEWSNDNGDFLNNNPMWVKVVDRFGGVTHIDWTNNFEAIRHAAGFDFPGYLFHESGAWSDALQRWVFVPRRASKERYSPDLDETKGANVLISADANFRNIKVVNIDIEMDANGVNPKGFSEIKFVPGQPNDIVALRSMEHKGVTKSWITVFNIDGKVLMPEVFIDDFKFEGLSFLDGDSQ